ncbi:MAG: response regulator transcription factor [Gemmatimonadetes bacterium]|nr:response regulator transcription factor [Gemmatimonadota bacterium]
MRKVAIVDGEPAARQRLAATLTRIHPDLAIVVESGNGLEAISRLRETPVDVAFVDVGAPGTNPDAVRALARLDPMPPVVFLATSDSPAARVLADTAVDYLLEPVDADRLAATVARLRQARAPAPPADRLFALADQLAAAGSNGSAKPRFRDRLAIGKGSNGQSVPIDEVERFESARNYVKVITTTGATQLIRSTLHEIESSVDPLRFVRIHRTTVVNVARVAKVEPWFSGDMVITLASGAKVRLSRSHREAYYRVAGRPA